MEQNRRQPSQPPAQAEQEYPEVMLEPIEDLGLVKMKSAKKRAAAKKKRQRRRTMIIVLSSVVALLLIVVVFFFVRYQQQAAAEAAAQAAAEEALRIQQEQDLKDFEEMANSTIFCNGVSVNGISIGGMTMDEAKTALAAIEQTLSSQKQIQLVYNNTLYPLDLSNMAYSTNLSDVLTEAYRLGKTGDLASMKAEKSDVEINGRAYTLTVSYDMTSMQSGVAQIAAQIDAVPQDACIGSVDEENHTIIFQDEVVGVTVDQTTLIQHITDALLNGVTTPVEIPVTETQPTVTRASLEGKYVLRASATTNFSSSTSARKYNVRKGAGLINGTVLKPGETFSTNDTLGTRTKSNGWKEANAYESGTVVPQYGGGVCQLSTTLYNAVVKADMEIVYRRNHSMPVTYVDKGLDATINSVGNEIDFQFKNNTLGDIVIFGYTTENNRLYFEIWGLPFATTEYDEIKLTSDRVSTTSPDGDEITVEVPVGTEKADGTLMVEGETYQAIARRDGYVYQSYKNYYLAGVFVRKEKLALSTYKAFAGEIWTCLVATPEPEITPEPLPTDEPTPTISTEIPG
ncbi:MAG TPA: VanW family protein [Feifaniaceae bacterium]|nr:VanW family protein [Feifaniaceae bacterium]